MGSRIYFNSKKFFSFFIVIGCDYWSMNVYKVIVLEEKEKFIFFFSIFVYEIMLRIYILLYY